MNPNRKQKLYIFAGLLTVAALLVTGVVMNTGTKGSSSEAEPAHVGIRSGNASANNQPLNHPNDPNDGKDAETESAPSSQPKNAETEDNKKGPEVEAPLPTNTKKVESEPELEPELDPELVSKSETESSEPETPTPVRFSNVPRSLAPKPVPVPPAIKYDFLDPLPSESELIFEEGQAEMFRGYKEVRRLIVDAKGSQDLAQWKPVLEATLTYLWAEDVKNAKRRYSKSKCRSAFTLEKLDKTDPFASSVSFSIIGDFLRARAPVEIIDKLIEKTEERIDLDSLSSSSGTWTHSMYQQRPLYLAGLHSLEALQLIYNLGASLAAQCPLEQDIDVELHLDLILNRKYKHRLTIPGYTYDFEKGEFNALEFDVVLCWSDAPEERIVALKMIIESKDAVIASRHIYDLSKSGIPDDLIIEAVKVAHKNGHPDYFEWLSPLGIALDCDRFTLAIELLKLGFNPLVEPDFLQKRKVLNENDPDYQRFLCLCELNDQIYKKHAELCKGRGVKPVLIGSEELKRFRLQ